MLMLLWPLDQIVNIKEAAATLNLLISYKNMINSLPHRLKMPKNKIGFNVSGVNEPSS